MAGVERSTTELVEEERQIPSHATQYFAAFSASMGAMAVGAAIGYSSPASAAFHCLDTNTTNANGTDDYSDYIDIYGDEGDDLYGDDDDKWWCLSKEERGWFAGTISIGALVGCLVAGLLINRLGRKGTMLASGVPLLGGWLLIGLAQNLAMLIIGRILCGLTTGISSLVVPTYTTEYASRDIRGALGSSFQLFITVGILYAYIFGAVVKSWKWLTLVCGTLGVVFVLLAAFLKESPNYLLSKGKETKARRSMQYFRGAHYNIEQEMADLKKSLADADEAQVSLRDLKQPYILKPLIITLLLMVFQQLAGVNAVIYNIVVIFHDAGTSISEDMSTIIVGVIQVIATACSSLLIDSAGRRMLLALSSSTMAVSIVCLGVFFYMKSVDKDHALSTLGWLPLTSLMVFISAFSIGYGPIPWIMMGELFSPGVKEAAGSLATCLNWTFVFIITFTFEPLQEAINDYGVYWLFGGLCAVNFVFVLLVVPETKGKTLQETTAHFGGPKA